MTDDTEAFRAAIKRLHRSKDAAYGNAWKKRGEVIGVMANIARKVDRLDSVIAGAPPTQDESLFDTAVDLLVYSLKYQAFLADLDQTAGRVLFGTSPVGPPYSNGVRGVEYLLDEVPLTSDNGSSVVTAAELVVTSFGNLEACFSLATATSAAAERLTQARALTNAAAVLVGSLVRETPNLYRNFIAAS